MPNDRLSSGGSPDRQPSDLGARPSIPTPPPCRPQTPRGWRRVGFAGSSMRPHRASSEPPEAALGPKGPSGPSGPPSSGRGPPPPAGRGRRPAPRSTSSSSTASWGRKRPGAGVAPDRRPESPSPARDRRPKLGPPPPSLQPENRGPPPLVGQWRRGPQHQPSRSEWQFGQPMLSGSSDDPARPRRRGSAPGGFAVEHGSALRLLHPAGEPALPRPVVRPRGSTRRRPSSVAPHPTPLSHWRPWPTNLSAGSPLPCRPSHRRPPALRRRSLNPPAAVARHSARASRPLVRQRPPVPCRAGLPMRQWSAARPHDRCRAPQRARRTVRRPWLDRHGGDRPTLPQRREVERLRGPVPADSDPRIPTVHHR